MPLCWLVMLIFQPELLSKNDLFSPDREMTTKATIQQPTLTLTRALYDNKHNINISKLVLHLKKWRLWKLNIC